ncbi:hypothetical protein [Streptomyces sp. t39]|uniref:hypothetical protein n=1 Tax=Streptomyces sp. t39 TaxID=1828156 RepID=UPI0011CEB6C9|nr:hypothetical protein [Streptomyces sp. t39]TXS44317.1 hypothetical protein EAO77_34680 [Streptomyces sp. t39]
MSMPVRAALSFVAFSALTLALATPAGAEPTVPDHAVIICDSASFYANYDSSTGPVGLKRTLERGNKVGHTRGAHPVYNGWAATFDFGPNDWGFVRWECLGAFGSW